LSTELVGLDERDHQVISTPSLDEWLRKLK